MNSDEVWARCQQCGTELNKGDKVCPKCGCTKKAFERKACLAIGLRLSNSAEQARVGWKRLVREMISRWRPSRSPELPHGVNETRTIDREKDEYHHIVKDAATGEIIHDEHEPLSQHKGKPRKPKGLLVHNC